MADFLANLNADQRRAVEYLDGPLLVVAGPGTGKTRVITHRIAHRVSLGTYGERVLGITFTNRAATEMHNRVSSLLSEESPVRMGTFHWMCNGLLRRWGHRIGYPRDFRLLTPAEARHALKRVVQEAWPRERPAGARIAAAVSARKNGASRDAVARRYSLAPEAVEAIGRRYALELRQARALDLDDLLYLSARLLREDEPTRQACRAWYQEIVVDEYQDTNPIQQELLTLLTDPHGSVVAVGDEDQAIYGWRQADSRGMHRFLEDFPAAELVHLTESYRSTKQILRAAGRLIAHNPERLGVDLQTCNPAGDRPICLVADDEADEAEMVAAEIARLCGKGGWNPSDVAVLYRINAQSRALEDAMVRHRIPYHIHAGTRFYERPEIKTVVAYLRLVLGDDDDAASLLASQVSGIGVHRLESMRDSAASEGLSLLALFGAPHAGLPRASAQRLRSIASVVESLRDMREAPLHDLAAAAIKTVVESPEVGSRADIESVVENLEELGTLVREMSARHIGLRQFVDRLSLSDGNTSRGGVSLMTLHAAKGLEFSVVFVAGLEEGLLPHGRSMESDAEVEEERRLAYVGITRARSRLYVSYAHARLLAGHHLIGGASRFIGEIGPENLVVRVSPRRRAKPRLSSVRVGDRVDHTRWGTGTVTATEGTGRDTLVTVEFDRGGRQRLQLCHAPFTRAGEERLDVLAG